MLYRVRFNAQYCPTQQNFLKALKAIKKISTSYRTMPSAI